MITEKLMRRLAVLLASAVMAMLLTACTSKRDTTTERFLYVINCEGSVDKLDIEERKRIATFQLSERSGSPPAVPSLAGGLDGCLAQRVTGNTVGKGTEVSMLSPKQARLDSEGLQDFQLLTFSLPEWKLTRAVLVGRFPEAPRLQRDPAGGLRVLRDAEWTPITQMHLRGYAGHDDDTGNLILESSGTVSLLSLLSAKTDRMALGLADQRTRNLTRLTDVPPTTIQNVHLAPGGGFLLVEVIEPDGAPVKRTGALRLYEANGQKVADFMDERIRGMAFVALTPNGTAVYRSSSAYHFVSLGRPFASDPVTLPTPDIAAPGLVFSKQ